MPMSPILKFKQYVKVLIEWKPPGIVSVTQSQIHFPIYIHSMTENLWHGHQDFDI